MKLSQLFLKFFLPVLALILLFQNMTPSQTQIGKPNIVFIMLDDAGYSDFTNKDIIHPTFDYIERNALKFTHFYTNPTCSPTRVSLLTGKNPTKFGFEHAIGLPNEITKDGTARGLPSGVKSLPTELNKLGYKTAHVGKWHVGERKNKMAAHQGFHDTIVYHYSNHGFNNPLIETYKNSSLISKNVIQGHKTDILTDQAIKLLRNYAATENTKPLFLNLWYNAPHHPNQPSQNWINKYTKNFSAESAERKELIKYFGAFSQVDSNIGRILREIQSNSKLANNTIIFITSDNGGAGKPGNVSNAPLKGSKGMVYEGGIRLPLYALWPNRIKGGISNHSPLRSSDLLPSLIELAGGAFEPPREGESFIQLLTAPSSQIKTRRVAMLWNQRPQVHFCGSFDNFISSNGWQKENLQQAIRVGNWKFVSIVKDGVSEEHLYNFTATESETSTNDLIRSATDKANELREQLYNTLIRRSRIFRKYSTISPSTQKIGENDFFIPASGTGGQIIMSKHDNYETHDGSFTFAVKIKPHVRSLGKNTVIAQRLGSWSLQISPTNKIVLTVWDDQSKKQVQLISKDSLSAGVEYSLAFTITGHTGSPGTEQKPNCLQSTYIHNVARLYLGVSSNSGTVKLQSVNPRNIYDVAVSGYDNPVYIARDKANSIASSYFGNIKVLGAHTIPLTSAQLATLFKNEL